MININIISLTLSQYFIKINRISSIRSYDPSIIKNRLLYNMNNIYIIYTEFYLYGVFVWSIEELQE